MTRLWRPAEGWIGPGAGPKAAVMRLALAEKLLEPIVVWLVVGNPYLARLLVGDSVNGRLLLVCS